MHLNLTFVAFNVCCSIKSVRRWKILTACFAINCALKDKLLAIRATNLLG